MIDIQIANKALEMKLLCYLTFLLRILIYHVLSYFS